MDTHQDNVPVIFAPGIVKGIMVRSTFASPARGYLVEGNFLTRPAESNPGAFQDGGGAHWVIPVASSFCNSRKQRLPRLPDPFSNECEGVMSSVGARPILSLLSARAEFDGVELADAEITGLSTLAR